MPSPLMKMTFLAADGFPLAGLCEVLADAPSVG
jgi:hypothetical protein